MSITKKDLQMLQLKKEQEKIDLFKMYSQMNHSIPRSRREFLSAGLTGVATALALPTLTQLISSSAWGAETVSCDGAGNSSFPAFIHLQLAGGAALFANYMQRGTDGDSINGQTIGIGANPSSRPLFSNGAPFWDRSPNSTTDGSSLMFGMLGRLSALSNVTGVADPATFLSNTASFCALAAESQDDSVSNPQDISGMLKAVGVTGSTLPYLLTYYEAPADELFSNPGNRFRGGLIPSSNLLTVNNVGSLEDSLGFKGTLSFNGNLNIQKQLIKSIEELSKKQVEVLARAPDSHESQKIFKGLITCATEKNFNVVSGNSIVDIYSNSYPDANAKTIWAKNLTGVHASFNPIIEKVGITATNCISGLSGAALINLGGYDYHLGRTRSRANEKDFEAGDVIGRILATAKSMNKRLFLYVSTDGSTFAPASSNSDANWQNDSPKKGTGYMIAFDPASAPPIEGYSNGSYIDRSYQLNHFTNEGVVSGENSMAGLDAQDVCASAVFLNYLNFAKKPQLINNAEVSMVRAKLMSAVPSGVDIFNYFTRFKS